jgi:AraC family transcriptional regulator of adaptative response / DNA-3-methyladenine glycosylase II
MFAAISQRNPEFNGQFITGVLTTGIYCLPSCPARTPKFENIQFFKKPVEARKAGLRACLRCKPDDYYANVDEDREIVLELARRMMEDPAQYKDAPALVRASGIGSTKLNMLWRRHFHITPKRSLDQARVAKAAKLLREDNQSLDDIAATVGFESLSTFHDQFRQRQHISPGAYRQIRSGTPYILKWPEAYRVADTLRYLQRDADDPLQSWQGERLTRTFSLGDHAGYAHLTFKDRQLEVEPFAEASSLPMLHDQLLKILGLYQDPSAFERFAVKSKGGKQLVEAARGLRLPQTPTPFEALVWAILGQQINLAFAYKLRQRLIQLVNRRINGELVHPSPQQIAVLQESQLLPLQFSRAKIAYLQEAAKAICEGRLNLDQKQVVSAEAIERELIAVRGIGTWTAQYVLMRGYGFADCIPRGDAGLRQGYALLVDQKKVENAEVETFLEGFSPYRTYATAHLWRHAALAATSPT